MSSWSVATKVNVGLILGLVTCAGLSGQIAASSTKATPANEWMTVPRRWVAGQDSLPPKIRASRDRWFDETTGSPTPLTESTGVFRNNSEGSYFGQPPEFPTAPNRAIMIGRFTSSQPVLSASARSIYTEAKFDVTDVFQQPLGAPASPNAITIGIEGGAVVSESGRVISYSIQPQRYFLEPGRLYLLILDYHKDGDFYLHIKDWDVTDGSVRANNWEDQRRERTGRSAILGLSTTQLTAYLKARFGRK